MTKLIQSDKCNI